MTIDIADDRAPGRLGVRFWMAMAAQGALAFMLLLAGAQKLAAGPSGVVMSLGILGWLPMAANRAIGAALPFAEIVLGFWIVSGKGPRKAAWVAILVLVCFSVVLVFLGNAIGLE